MSLGDVDAREVIYRIERHWEPERERLYVLSMARDDALAAGDQALAEILTEQFRAGMDALPPVVAYSLMRERRGTITVHR